MIFFSAHLPSVQYLLFFLSFVLSSGGYFLLPLYANISDYFAIYIYILRRICMYIIYIPGIYLFFSLRGVFSRRVATGQVSDETGQSVNSVIKPANPSNSQSANQSVIFFSRWTPSNICCSGQYSVVWDQKRHPLPCLAPPPPLFHPQREQLDSMWVSSTATAAERQELETRAALLSKQTENASVHAEKIATETAAEVQSLKDALEGSRRESAQASEESREYSAELEVGQALLFLFCLFFCGLWRKYVLFFISLMTGLT